MSGGLKNTVFKFLGKKPKKDESVSPEISDTEQNNNAPYFADDTPQEMNQNPSSDSDDTSNANADDGEQGQRPRTLGEFAEQEDLSGMSSGDSTSSLSELTTVKKKRILAIIVCVAAFGVGAIATTSMFSDNSIKKNGDPETAGEIRPHTGGGSTVANNTKGLPSDYASISKYQSDRKQASNQAKGKAGTQSGYDTTNPTANANSANEYDNLAPRPLPPIQSCSSNSNSSSGSYSGPTSSGSSDSGYSSGGMSREEQEAEQARAERAKADKKAYTSAIAFVSEVSRSASANGSSGGSQTVTLKPDANGGTAFFGSDPAESGSEYTLQSGSVVQATLLTGINSDMGNTTVMAQVSQNVYDTDTGTHLLIPQGSKLIGKAGSVGGNRIGVTFERLIFPDGSDVDLPNIGVIDGTGIPGMKDQYNSHDATFFRGALISGLLGYLSDKVDDNSGSSTSNSGWGSTTTYNDNLSDVVSNITDRLMERVDRQSDRAATVTVRPGFQFSIFINADLQIPEFTGYSFAAGEYDGFLT